MSMQQIACVQIESKLDLPGRTLLRAGDTDAQASAGQYSNGNPSIKLCDEVLEKLSSAIRNGQRAVSLNIVGNQIVESPVPTSMSAVAAAAPAAMAQPQAASMKPLGKTSAQRSRATHKKRQKKRGSRTPPKKRRTR